MPLFLFLTTLIVAGGIVNEGGHKAIEEKGFVEAVETAWDEREPVFVTQKARDLYESKKQKYND